MKMEPDYAKRIYQLMVGIICTLVAVAVIAGVWLYANAQNEHRREREHRTHVVACNLAKELGAHMDCDQ